MNGESKWNITVLSSEDFFLKTLNNKMKCLLGNFFSKFFFLAIQKVDGG